jgi:hypothetical protein
MLRQALVLLIVVAIFGILVPWYRGFSFLQPWIIVAYGAMALLFVAPASAELWSSNPPPESTRAALGRIFAVVGYGWGVTLLMLASAVAVSAGGADGVGAGLQPDGVHRGGGAVCAAGAPLIGPDGKGHSADLLSGSAIGAGVRVALFAGVMADRAERPLDAPGDHADGVGGGGGFGCGSVDFAVPVAAEAGHEQRSGGVVSASKRAFQANPG